MERRPGFFKRFWLLRCSKPAHERPLLQAITKTIATAALRSDGTLRVMELGLGEIRRAGRILRLAATRKTRAENPFLHYVGLDRFEARLPSDPPGVTLKQAHQSLHKLARVQLVPGNVDTSLSRLCNHLGTFDVVLVSLDADPRHVERSWFFIQRLVTPSTAIFVEQPVGGGVSSRWQRIGKARVDELAARAVGRRVA